MPTIKQLPLATSVNATDLLPLSQGGTTKGLAVGDLLSSTQPALSVLPGSLLGRVSTVAGGPEPVAIGSGLAVASGVLEATADDHTRLPMATAIGVGDEVVVNSGGAAKRLNTAILRSLFSAGSGVAIDPMGTISATPVAATTTAPPSPATASSIGAVKPGTGLTVASDGTLSTDGGAVRTQLGLGTSAVLSVGTSAGTVAAGNDARIVGAQTAGQVSLAIQAALADGSGLPSTALGGTVARTLAVRESERASVADQSGSDPTGVADSAAAFTAAITRGATASVPAFVPAGSYRLNSVIYTGQNQSWEMSDTRFSGPGVIVGAGDWSPFQNRVAKALLNTTNAPGNEFSAVTTLAVGVTGAATSYEKAAGYDYAYTYDPSTYSGSGLTMSDVVDADVVARQMTGAIMPGNLTGRVWGLTAQASVSTGADGAAAAGEFDVMNNGSDQPYSGQPTSKTGIGIIALGTAKCTVAAIVASAGTGQWHDGVLVRQEAVADTAFRITKAGSVTDDVFHVKPTGDLVSASVTTGPLTVSAGAASLRVAADGTVTLGGSVTVPTATMGTNSGAAASTAFVQTAVANLVGTAPATLSTLGKLAAQLASDESGSTALATVVGGKLDKAANLSDLASAATARGNLGLGGAAALGVGTAAGSVAAGNDPRITGALSASAASSTYQLLGAGTLAARVVTAAGPASVVGADGIVVVRKAAGAATTLTLESSPVVGALHVIKDGKGDAAANPITVLPASGTIDGGANFVVGANYGAVTLLFTGIEWSVI